MMPPALALLFWIPLSLAADPSQVADGPEAAFLRELVSISSGTADAAGVDAVHAKVAERLKGLGFAVELVANADPANASGKQLVATRPGKDTKRFITFVGHADTVFEKLNPWELSADGKQAKGSGVSDAKGGLVVGIRAIEDFLKKKDVTRFGLRFVSSPSEEIGSVGFQDKLREYSRDSAFIIGLEPAHENGEVVTARKGIRWYLIKVTGKEAHAGGHHDQGVNACLDLASKLDRISRLTDYKVGNTVSIGRMEGGKDKHNIVCGEAMAKVDTRFLTAERGKRLAAQVDAILKEPSVRGFVSGEATKTEVTYPAELPALSESKAARPYLTRYLSEVEKLEGQKPATMTSGGAADLNYMAREGALILDGLGPRGGGYHTAEEYVVLDSLKTRADALARLLEHLDAKLP